MKRESLKTLGIEVSRNITASDLFRMTREELLSQDMKDKISALRELCEEFCEYKSRAVKTIKNSEDAARLMAHRLKCLDHEECWVLLLDMACHPIKKERITSGGASACIIDIPRIVKTAVIAGASGLILCHNHPSGCVNPSRSDLEQTKKLKAVLSQLGVVLNDHLILADGKYFSFSDEKVSEIG